MSGLLLDTSVVIAAERRTLDLGAVTAGRLDLCFLSAVTATELLHGVHRADTEARRRTRAAFVEAVLGAFPILELDLAAARVAARLWADLRTMGTPLPTHDLWLAASALAHSLSLLTLNVADFRRVPGLVVESWSTPAPPATPAPRRARQPRMRPAIPPSD